MFSPFIGDGRPAIFNYGIGSFVIGDLEIPTFIYPYAYQPQGNVCGRSEAASVFSEEDPNKYLETIRSSGGDT